MSETMEKQNKRRRRLGVAEEGSMVLLDINGGDKSLFVHLNSTATLKLKNIKCSLSPIIGSPYGTLFQVETGPNGLFLKQIDSSSKDLEGCEDEKDLDQESKDNRSLIDNNRAQKLSAEEINLMRSEGVSGGQIVEAIIANSSTFHNKTVYSQEKYRRKKQKKFLPHVLLRRPCARSICEAYFNKSPTKIGFLRMDSLSLLLSLSNVGAHSDILVFDMVGGLVVGAVAERLGGFGSVCNVYPGVRPPSMDVVGLFNFDESTLSRICRAPLSELLSVHRQHLKSSDLSTNVPLDKMLEDKDVASQNIESNTKPEELVPKCTLSEESKQEHDVSDVEVDNNSKQNLQGTESERKGCCYPSMISDGPKLSKFGRQAATDDIHRWKENGFASLIVAATEYDPWTIVEELMPLIVPSGSFAIYHQCIQPLAECMLKLQKKQIAVALQISEPWLREYQVLPSRTHPHMQMSSSGGYVLSGIHVGHPIVGENKGMLLKQPNSNNG